MVIDDSLWDKQVKLRKINTSDERGKLLFISPVQYRQATSSMVGFHFQSVKQKTTIKKITVTDSIVCKYTYINYPK